MEKNRKNNAAVMIALIVAVVVVVFAGAVLLKKTPGETKVKEETSVQTVVEEASASSGTSAPESRAEISQETPAEATQESVEDHSVEDHSVEDHPDASDTSTTESTETDNENRQNISSTESAAEPDPYQPDNFEILDMPAELYSLIANPEQLRVGLYDFCFNNINKNITKAYVYNEYSVDNGSLVFTVEADGREVVVKINESGSASFAV